MITLQKMSEQVARAAARMRGSDRVSFKEIAEAKPFVIQATNKVLGLIPTSPSVGIATYNAVSVTDNSPEYVCDLPVRPVQKEHDRGVHEVSLDSAMADPFIPIPNSMFQLVKSMPEGVLEQQVGFFIEGDKIYFTKNPGAVTVRVKLIVADPGTLADSDPLPIPSDLEQEVLTVALQIMFPGQNKS